VLALPLLVAIFSAATELMRPARYGLTARLIVTQSPLATAGAAENPDSNSVGSWQASEFILDDLPQVLTSESFARDVSAQLAQQGYQVATPEVQGAISAATTHRSVDLAVSAGSPQLPALIARAAAETLRVNGLKYWDRQGLAGGPGLQVAVLSLPETAAPLANTRRAALNVALRTALALAAAVGIAFLLHYLDRSLYDRAQVEALVGAPVVGSIPPERVRTRKG
jgi:capsular polysaccharide biosynthesis protein